MYAIVDIETTGGHAASNGITEIAIALHDGVRIHDFYETLINPGQKIPYFIQKLTGINEAMVANAPTFEEVAPIIYEMLHDKIFVAHNVNFDYSFVKYQLAEAGLQLNTKKLCTIRAARKIIPGLPAYGLGKISQSLKLNHTNKHRAGGDVLATAELLALLHSKDDQGHIYTMLHGKNIESYLPPNVNSEEVKNLPRTPGVYYFYNKKGQVIYVGKAVDLRKRVQSHFSNNKTGKTKQHFLREITRIGYQACGTDLLASIRESAEIRSLWPRYNRSQRGFQPLYGLVRYEDRAGKIRLAVERLKRNSDAIYTFNTLQEGKQMLLEKMNEFQLCPSLLNLCSPQKCKDYVYGHCHDECTAINIAVHNDQMLKALESIQTTLPTFAFVDKGRREEEISYVLVKRGQLLGIGYLPEEKRSALSMPLLEEHLQTLPGNDYMRNLVYKQAEAYPEKLLHLNVSY